MQSSEPRIANSLCLMTCQTQGLLCATLVLALSIAGASWGGRGYDDDNDNGDDDLGDNEPGIVIPEIPDGGIMIVSGTGGSVIRSGDVGEETSCERYAAESAAGRNRLEGSNLQRLKIGGRMIAPTYTSDAPGYAGFAERYMSYYQEELEKPAPSLVTVGTYLGLIAERVVDPAIVNRVDRALCLTQDAERGPVIAETAEEQRDHIGRSLGILLPQ